MQLLKKRQTKSKLMTSIAYLIRKLNPKQRLVIRLLLMTKRLTRLKEN